MITRLFIVTKKLAYPHLSLFRLAISGELHLKVFFPNYALSSGVNNMQRSATNIERFSGPKHRNTNNEH